ncbi:uncharacterized protein LOC110991862 isoform X2 [Pieris rapae]|uniref:uncharacterized protein LOC110991862 isoform X2 n=1 Tax=Pieris rapae TaxID=64459 RepID=UPI001E27FEAB|nr:uncharacterized protein LOC110991862 isoform X2 [Pieris rapae]
MHMISKHVAKLKFRGMDRYFLFKFYISKYTETIPADEATLLACAGEIYEPTWFAYQLMESFLLPVYTRNTGLNSKTQSTPKPEANDTENDTETTENHNNLEGPSNFIAASSSTPSTNKSTEKTRRRQHQDMAEQQMASAFSQLTNALSHRSSEVVKEDDECDLYAKLLAKKIRELPKDDRRLLMYEIDGLCIRRINRRSFSRDTPSPNYFEPYARSYTANRPSSAQTSYSEPSSKLFISSHDYEHRPKS